MTAPRCPICFDTGMANDSDMLDCGACSAATDRAALNAYVKSLGPVSAEDRDWLVAQWARARAELAFIEDWLRTFAEPIGQQCCGSFVIGGEYMGQQEHVCCGNPDPDFWNAADMTAAMNKRRDEIIAAITATKE